MAALLLTLTAEAIALLFVYNTTGGTLFLFTVATPVLVLLAIVIVGGVTIYEFVQRHKLFAIERYQPGQLIFRQGEMGDCVYFIRSGEVEVVRDSGGVESAIATLGQGQYFGEMALLSNQPRNATVRALVATELAAVGKSNFLSMLSSLPAAEEDILKTVRDRAMQDSLASEASSG